MPRGTSNYLKPKGQTIKELDEAIGEGTQPQPQQPPPQQPAPKPAPKQAPKPKPWWEQ